MKEFVKKIYQKTESRLGVNTGKIITFILFGILLLVVVMPVESCSGNSDETENEEPEIPTGIFSYNSTEGSIEASEETVQNITGESEYYETRLKNILESSYGKDSVQVMVHMKQDSEKGLYGDVSEESTVDGVLVVADIKNANDKLEISEAVCALFNLPACKVYVIGVSK